MLTDDILLSPLPMGAHAQASYRSRMQALREYGISPSAISITDDNRHIAQAARQRRQHTLSNEQDLMAA
jgi:hypothetical protein